jgi:hypothetical protein
MTHPDFAEIIAALEPIAQRTGQACSHVFSDVELRCVRDAIPKLRALANVWEALQSSEAYRDARAMWHVGGVLTEAGEEHLAQSFAWKNARIAELESALAAYCEKRIPLCLERDAYAIDAPRIRKEALENSITVVREIPSADDPHNDYESGFQAGFDEALGEACAAIRTLMEK